MAYTFIFILSVAALIAIFHMIAPDHWLPLTVISEAKRFSSLKKYSFTAVIAFLHGAFSSAVALAFLYAGLVFLGRYVKDLTIFGLVLLVAAGTYFIINGYMEKNSSRVAGNASLAVGTFPDLAIVPLLLSAPTLSAYQIALIITSFILAGIASLTAVVFSASFLTDFALKRLKPAYFDYAVGLTLLVTAVLVYLGTVL